MLVNFLFMSQTLPFFYKALHYFSHHPLYSVSKLFPIKIHSQIYYYHCSFEKLILFLFLFIHLYPAFTLSIRIIIIWTFIIIGNRQGRRVYLIFFPLFFSQTSHGGKNIAIIAYGISLFFVPFHLFFSLHAGNICL